jgi:hypothetical protein
MDSFGDFPEDEFTPDELAKIRRGIQEANMGFTYEMLKTDDGCYVFKCNKCNRSAGIGEKPFPHRFNCPMKHMGRKD